MNLNAFPMCLFAALTVASVAVPAAPGAATIVRNHPAAGSCRAPEQFPSGSAWTMAAGRDA